MIADVTKDEVIAFAPELATVSDGTWPSILAFINEIDMTYLGESANTTRLARIYLAAHIAKMGKRAASSAAGPVTSESAGGIRRSYGFAALTDTHSLRTTNYGQLYLDLLGMTLAHGPFLA
ncbi:MAG: DUF4054 domain-containing protein [Kofleriaceae bacterium]